MTGVILVLHAVGYLLSFPSAFAGVYVGKYCGLVVGAFTAPLGSTWLDISLATGGKGCIVGAALGVALPWYLISRSELQEPHDGL